MFPSESNTDMYVSFKAVPLGGDPLSPAGFLGQRGRRQDAQEHIKHGKRQSLLFLWF